jgi:hypothetical protein
LFFGFFGGFPQVFLLFYFSFFFQKILNNFIFE